MLMGLPPGFGEKLRRTASGINRRHGIYLTIDPLQRVRDFA